MFVAILVLSIAVRAQANNDTIKDNKMDVDPYWTFGTTARQPLIIYTLVALIVTYTTAAFHVTEIFSSTGRQLFDFRKNGIRVDVSVVPSRKNDSARDDGFPVFPTSDIGRCIIDLSLICAKKCFGRFLESIRDLNEIYLLGQEIKLVKAKLINNRRSISDSNDTIERSVNDFFDTFALRITLPRWNGKPEKNQIDVMFDETAIVEGRGKGGGGGGGKVKKQGGGCKMMMMAGLMMLKMKLMGVATMKGMMMAGMSLMISMAMLMQKYMKGGGGGHGGGGGGQYKEIVLLTKASGGGGGGGGGGYGGGGGGGYGGGGGGGGGDISYGAPPPSSYGPPSGWGRSFDRKFITSDLVRTNYAMDPTNSSLQTEQPNTDFLDHNHGRSPVNSTFAYTNWNYSNQEEPRRYLSNDAIANVGNISEMEPLLHAESSNYAIDANPYRNEGSGDYAAGSRPAISYANIINHVAPTNYIANNYDKSATRPAYVDEWQATEEKFDSPDLRNAPETETSNVENNLPSRGI